MRPEIWVPATGEMIKDGECDFDYLASVTAFVLIHEAAHSCVGSHAHKAGKKSPRNSLFTDVVVQIPIQLSASS